jgi:hypothetical protein
MPPTLANPIAAALARDRLAKMGDPNSSRLNIGATLDAIRADLHGGQVDIFDDMETREIGVAAGYGAGKTLAACAKAFQLATLNQGFIGCVLEPTGPMLRDIWIRKFDAFLDHYGIPYTFRASPLPEHILHLPGGNTPVLARSFENFKRIVGPDWAWALVDEVDTVQENIAARGYEKIIGRIRVGLVNQLIFLSTPEGFVWHYKTFGTEEALADPGKRLIRMRTQDNPHLPESYLDNLRTRYTSTMLKAYMDGIYVNLKTGQVYDRFSRDFHVRPLPGGLRDGEYIILGIDFNVGNMSGVLGVLRGRDFHAFDEIMGANDTDDLCGQIKKRYPKRIIHAYPDASGGNRSTNASMSDIGILKSYGFQNCAPPANPPVRDRVNVVQALLLNAKGDTRLWFDPKCVKLIEAQERQGYNQSGEPDKTTGYDHPNDALGYPLHRLFAAELGYGPGGPMRVTTVHYGRGAGGPDLEVDYTVSRTPLRRVPTRGTV